MQRYFVGEKDINNHQVTIVGDDFHHIVKVMRMMPGDEFEVVCPDEKIARCTIERIDSTSVLAKILNKREDNRELPIQVAIASSLIKGDKWEWVIQKGTELGASHFFPFTSARSVVKWDERKASKKVERWGKIAKEAAEQSERNRIPEVASPINIKQLLDKARNFTKTIVAYEEKARAHESKRLLSVFENLKDEDSLLMIFGPEGGFSKEEVTLFEEAGFILCGLGPRILRAETAPLYGLSALSFYFELQR